MSYRVCVCVCSCVDTPLVLDPTILQVAGGLLSEALMLLDRGMQANINIATRAIGYRQALDFLQVGPSAPVWQGEQEKLLCARGLFRDLNKNGGNWLWLEAVVCCSQECSCTVTGDRLPCTHPSTAAAAAAEDALF